MASQRSEANSVATSALLQEQNPGVAPGQYTRASLNVGYTTMGSRYPGGANNLGVGGVLGLTEISARMQRLLATENSDHNGPAAAASASPEEQNFNAHLAEEYRAQILQLQREREEWTGRQEEQLRVVRACLAERDQLKRTEATRQQSLKQFQKEMSLAVESLDADRQRRINDAAVKDSQLHQLAQENASLRSTAERVEGELQAAQQSEAGIKAELLQTKEQLSTAQSQAVQAKRELDALKASTHTDSENARQKALASAAQSAQSEAAAATSQSNLKSKARELEAANQRQKLEISRLTHERDGLSSQLSLASTRFEAEKAGVNAATKADMERKLLKRISEEQEAHNAAMELARGRHKSQLEQLVGGAGSSSIGGGRLGERAGGVADAGSTVASSGGSNGAEARPDHQPAQRLDRVAAFLGESPSRPGGVRIGTGIGGTPSSTPYAESTRSPFSYRVEPAYSPMRSAASASSGGGRDGEDGRDGRGEWHAQRSLDLTSATMSPALARLSQYLNTASTAGAGAGGGGGVGAGADGVLVQQEQQEQQQLMWSSQSEPAASKSGSGFSDRASGEDGSSKLPDGATLLEAAARENDAIKASLRKYANLSPAAASASRDQRLPRSRIKTRAGTGAGTGTGLSTLTAPKAGRPAGTRITAAQIAASTAARMSSSASAEEEAKLRKSRREYDRPWLSGSVVHPYKTTPSARRKEFPASNDSGAGLPVPGSPGRQQQLHLRQQQQGSESPGKEKAEGKRIWR